MIKNIVKSVLTKGALAVVGIILIFAGAGAASEGSDMLGTIAFLIGLVILIGLKTRGK